MEPRPARPLAAVLRPDADADALVAQAHPTSHDWSPLTTMGVTRAVHGFVVLAWLFVLLPSVVRER